MPSIKKTESKVTTWAGEEFTLVLKQGLQGLQDGVEATVLDDELNSKKVLIGLSAKSLYDFGGALQAAALALGHKVKR